MFSGKSTELLRRVTRVRLAKKTALVFKPSIDTRYGKEQVGTHTGASMGAISIPPEDPWEMIKVWLDIGEPKTVGIDEGQFFDGLAPVVERLIQGGTRVIVAGLDLDFRGEPFLEPRLLAIAEDVTKLTAVCMTCGAPATRTQRLSGGDELVQVGAGEAYEARCQNHWTGSLRG